MSPQRWREIEDLYHAALEQEPAARAALLESADPELRSEVESLLAQTGTLPDLQSADSALEALTGTTLGPYRIETMLGAGGMGRVYRATDTRLHRTVAVKILPYDKTVDRARRRRFLQEARAASALNHPNIVTVHDIASDNGIDYLVMEYVPGKSLDRLIPPKGLPLAEAVSYAKQIAGALAAAHAAGIVHRDIKPGNIIVTPEGQVKVLDFGLAKLEERAIGAEDDTLTMQSRLTEAGLVMGTPAYMAPEQKAGKSGDARADIYAFGRVLYQMLTGSRDLRPSTRVPSRKLEKMVNRCLEEDPELRWQHALALEEELKGVAYQTRSKLTAAAAAAILSLATIASLYLHFHRAPRLTDKDTIVLADFDNKTDDPVFDDALRQGLSVDLQQSPFLGLISDQQVQDTLALMGRPKDARLTPEIAQQICERTGSAVVLEGSIASLGSQFVLGLRAKNCNSGTLLDQEQIQVARREDVLNSLSQIARAFRTKAGESLATVEKHSTPLPEASTPSLEALKAYSTAMRVDLSAGEAAIPFFERAVAIDHGFAMAYANLGLDYTAVGEWALASENATKAWQLRDHASDREKFFITFIYDRQVTGNLEAAFQTLELWAQTYPRRGQPDPRDLMAGISSQGTGRWEREIEQARQSIDSDPRMVFGYSNLANGDLFLDRLDDEERVFQQASAQKRVSNGLLTDQYNVAFLKGDQAEMARVIALAKGQRGAEHEIAISEALALARTGHLQQARRASTEAVQLARQEGEQEAAATYRAVAGVWEALCGNSMEARKDATSGLLLSHGRDVEYAAGLALAFSSDLSQSDALAADLEKRFPEDTFVKFTYVPVLRAVAALHRRQPAESIDQLQVTLPYELAANGLSFQHSLGGLHSAYVRGEALAAEHQYADAAASYQKILDHRGVVGVDPIGALVHLQLGRTFALAGDVPKAKTAYQDFLTLWKDADPDIPVLEQAKAEYAKLQ